MASERKPRRRRPRSAVRRAWLFCFWLSLPGLLFASILLYQQKLSTGAAILIACSLLLYLVLIAAALIESLVRPLQTLSNVVASMREADYSFRARGAGSPDALGELATEVNLLADLLQKQRVRSLEATALLARILEVMHAPLYAFDREDVLQLVNTAGTQLLNRPYARCFGHSAQELGLEDLLKSADQTIHSFGDKGTRWLLRKTSFRQEGIPHTLLLLADVSVPLQEEEQAAWKRLIRVLGHELSNSLAPIKSIAGSLLARVDAMDGDPDTMRDFRRGLGVVENRADSLHRFVQSYRLLAQLPPPHLKSVSLHRLLEQVVLLEQRLSVVLEAGPPITLHADPDQLEQMFINLLANAVDATVANNAQSVHVGWRVADSAAWVTIEDTGMGIANTDNLFVPFYTTKPKGSGVGLALAQQIARAHGGEIRLVNREGDEGARATVRLPIA
ncbi:sensor histidine kinase [Occallatibacter riparius]|uniref:histidine kinase n=1 Tax=Occallatibacter riparius TaxID=1002689 RepID=A0A9J7BUV4_9BACT|nr:ATP-binding protein [Occallatibacter riparius]UWZ86660.1 ATP-binding protein [Occallatibacter riparius]